MRYGICLANLGTFSDPRVPVELGLAAEEHGWDAVFIWDHLAFVWKAPAADPWTVLAALAATTKRVRLGTAVTPVARRRPQVVAHQIATLDNLSGGRVTFGAGLGGSASEFGKFGEPTDAKVRAAMLDEGLELLRGLWSGKEVTHHGEHYTVDGVTLAPTPTQARVPIWIGGNRPASLRRAARWDGWLADSADPTGMTLSPEEVARSIATIGRSGDYDVAVLGERDRGDPVAYAEAGATWWLENLHDRRGTPEKVLRLVEQGPPGERPLSSGRRRP
ncbi:MAG: TIGR03619 family F420-dependent LLM class oxidoreductase [Actinobacteria bacterium]|nr:TIGR03619 family F420-dependent LLM class oxidoreductase [Actinomycetota bacterium]